MWLKGKKNYITAYDIIAEDNYEITLLETYPCKSKDELEAREKYWMERTVNRVNKMIPTRTSKEYREDNKERITKGKREYYMSNKDRILQHQKEYEAANRERINEYHKQYYHEKIAHHLKEKVQCECGSSVTRASMYLHNKSKKHLAYLSHIQNPSVS
jgi:ATP-dependent Lon protease